MDSKQKLRRRISAALKSISSSEIQNSSASVVKNIFSLLSSSGGICIFVSSAKEVQTSALIKEMLQHDIRVYVPRVASLKPPTMQMIQIKTEEDMNKFIINQWGIPEPPVTSESIIATPLDLDTIIVPGVAFDDNCGRCGHGMGFYDRYILETAKARVSAGKQPSLLIGLAMSQQIVSSVPMESHDCYMNIVVTPTSIYRKDVSDDSSDTGTSTNGDEESLPTSSQDIIFSIAKSDGSKKSRQIVFQQKSRRSASTGMRPLGMRPLSKGTEDDQPKRRRSTGLHNLWAELASGHQHSDAHSGRESISSVRLSSSTKSSRSRLTWKERLDLVKAIDFRGGWRIVPPPPDKRQRDKMFNERFGWMSQSGKVNNIEKSEWHQKLRRQRIESTEARTSTGSIRPQVAEKQTTWVSWGSGSSGVLGQGHFEDVHAPQFTALKEYPADIAIGGNHIVAVDKIGTSLYTWGKNESGQLGNGHTNIEPSYDPHIIGKMGTIVAAKKNVQVKEEKDDTMIKSGEEKVSKGDEKDFSFSSVASIVSTHSKLMKWRRSTAISALSRLALGKSKVTRISCGWDHTIVIIFGGETFGWGSNSRGQLGIGKEKVGNIISLPTRIIINDVNDGSTNSVIGVSTGRAHSLLLRGDGSMYGFGDNKYHQLGLQTNENDTSSYPELLPSPGRVEWSSPKIVIDVSCGWQFSSAISHSGEVFTWGDNRKNQCALDSTKYPTVKIPTLVNFSSERSTSITKIACGWSHMLALDKNGTVYSWGRFDMGQLGIGTNIGSNIAVKPEYSDTFVFKVRISKDEQFGKETKNKIIQIACGSEHSLAVTAGGDLYSWGWGEHGNLGHGTTTNEYLPKKVSKFGEANGCYVRDVRTGGASVFARVDRTTHL
jgi:5,10-methenyltetrahydrofolate synthetase